MKRSLISLAIMALSPRITQTPVTAFIGAAADAGTLGQNLAALAANSQSVAGGWNFQTSAASTLTATNLGNLLQRFTVGSAMTLTLDSAYNICKTLPQPLVVGQTFGFEIVTNAATTIATPTLSDTAVTLAGTTAVLAASYRRYQGNITQVNSIVGMPVTAGTTFTSLTQVGSTNNFTVVLGTNTLVPVVGTLIYLNVTAGTLPSGWYPINLVSSATSFVIAAPAGTVWTATAATVGTSIVAPSTYSPMLTVTGLYSLVVSTVAV